MIEDILAKLEAEVHQAIASLGAGSQRKQLIREELDAHLSEVYEEELARLGDPQLAAQATWRRFGDSEELRGQLQSSVPLLESLFFTYFCRREISMSRWWTAAIVALLVATAIAIPDSIGFVVGVLSALAGIWFARQCQQNRILGRHWPWIVGLLAALIGPGLVLPALAKLKQHAIEAAGAPGPHLFEERLLGPLALGTLITLGGLGLFAYGIGKNWRTERA
jgi:hypothetical protein